MFVVIIKKRCIQAGLTGLIFACLIGLFQGGLFLRPPIPVDGHAIDEEIPRLLQRIIALRNRAIIMGDLRLLASLYDQTTTYGVWAYTHQKDKTKYLAAWANKQGIRFLDLHTVVWVNRYRPENSVLSINFLASTAYKYVYSDDPLTVNSFRVGTYHSLDLTVKEQTRLVTREWYTDPFAASPPPVENEQNREYILSRRARDFSGLNPRRTAAVAYADRYAGAAAAPDSGFVYNRAYKNYNYLGGDCTNFASQILHEGGGLKKTPGWNYEKEGSPAWVNAEAFKNYMLYSGRASLLARGVYHEVLKTSYELLPGDLIAYEKKGEIAHISVVTGADSRGYSLVNSHNVDRYRVPWDLGWSHRQTKFWLLRVHY